MPQSDIATAAVEQASVEAAACAERKLQDVEL